MKIMAKTNLTYKRTKGEKQLFDDNKKHVYEVNRQQHKMITSIINIYY